MGERARPRAASADRQPPPISDGQRLLAAGSTDGAGSRQSCQQPDPGKHVVQPVPFQDAAVVGGVPEAARGFSLRWHERTAAFAAP